MIETAPRSAHLANVSAKRSCGVAQSASCAWQTPVRHLGRELVADAVVEDREVDDVAQLVQRDRVAVDPARAVQSRDVEPQLVALDAIGLRPAEAHASGSLNVLTVTSPSTSSINRAASGRALATAARITRDRAARRRRRTSGCGRAR